jgi:hypothetical protein
MNAAIIKIRKTDRVVEGKNVFVAEMHITACSGFVVMLPGDATDEEIANKAKAAAKAKWPSLIATSVTIVD